jgi:hypothetical protein
MVLDDGTQRHAYVLDRPNLALQIGPMIWREMHDFLPNTVLVVLASAHYSETDYINNYETFISLVSGEQR